MSTTSLSDTGTLHIDDRIDGTESAAEENQKLIFEHLRQQAIAKYRHALSATDSITARDLEEYEQHSHSESGWEAAGAKTYEDRARMVRDDLEKWIPDMIRTHLSLESQFYGNLSKAVKQKWISEESAREWEARLKSTDVQHWEKEKFLKDSFPVFLKNWEKVAEDRNDVQKLARRLKLTTKDVPELADILNDKAFVSLHYLSKVHKVSKVKALLLAANKKKQGFIKFIEKELESWASEGFMHSSKVGPWMRRVMENDNPEQFASKVLYPFKTNWKEARDRYDAVMPALKKEPDKMRGFTQIKAEKFLLLDYDARIAYIEEAESRLESDVNEEGELAALRLDIRYAMDTEDWEEAERLLGEAQALDPDDKAVRSMARYLAAHRTDTLEPEEQERTDVQKKGIEAMELQREILAVIPTNMRTMTEWAMRSSNPNAVKRVWQVFYNRHWVISNGYSTEQEDQEQSFSEVNQEETEDSIVNGHDWRFARRVIKDETANDAGIRDECVKPQVIYTNRGGLREVYEGVERNADNPKFGYWTTLIDDEVPYDSLREALQFMYQIRTNDRLMREAGMVYTARGTPFSVN